MSKDNPATREQQAFKIFKLLNGSTPFGDSFGNKLCLDIGCGNGEVSYYLSGKFKAVIGLEIKFQKIETNKHPNQLKNKPRFLVADGTILPFIDNSLDLVICAQVYEHVENQEDLLAEIWRVLKPNGICFFSGPNKYAILEEHYYLPFLSWLPSKLADVYLRLFNRAQFYDVFPLSYPKLRSLMKNFYVEDLTFKLIKNPSHYGMVSRFGILKILQHLPIHVLTLLFVFIPNFNFVLRKPDIPG